MMFQMGVAVMAAVTKEVECDSQEIFEITLFKFSTFKHTLKRVKNKKSRFPRLPILKFVKNIILLYLHFTFWLALNLV